MAYEKIRTLWHNDRIFRRAAVFFGVSLVVFTLSLGASGGRATIRPSVLPPAVQDQNIQQAEPEDSSRSPQAGEPKPRKPRPKYGVPSGSDGH